MVSNENNTLVLRFGNEGAYPLVLEAMTGECSAFYSGNITVNKAQRMPYIGDAEQPFIIDFTISPNPSLDGNFNIHIDLQEESPIAISIYSLAQQKIDLIKKDGLKQYAIPYTLRTSGVYIVLLETAKGSDVRKLIVK